MDVEVGDEKLNASSSKRFCRALTFHPLKEHAYSCPYVLEKQGEFGWMRMLRALPTDPLFYGFVPDI